MDAGRNKFGNGAHKWSRYVDPDPQNEASHTNSSLVNIFSRQTKNTRVSTPMRRH